MMVILQKSKFTYKKDYYPDRAGKTLALSGVLYIKIKLFQHREHSHTSDQI